MVLSSANTITGAGQVGLNTLQIVNTGAIIASGNAGLVVDPLDTLTNNGTLQADGGTLQLIGGTYTGGVISALNSSVVQVGAGALVQSASFQSDATGAGTNMAGGTIANSTNSGLIFVGNTGSGNLQGSLHNVGVLALQSGGNNTDFVVIADLALTGGGTLSLSNRTANRIRSGATGLTFTTTNLITGSGQIGLDDLAIVNSGTITASSSTGMTASWPPTPTLRPPLSSLPAFWSRSPTPGGFA